MKQTTTLLSIIAASGLMAQPTFQQSNLSTTTEGYTVYSVTDLGSITEPSAGANQTWDFSSIQVAVFGTSTIGPSAGLPNAASYPAANYAFTTTPTGGATDYAFLLSSSTGLETVASHVPMATNVYSDYEKILQFPMSMGGSYTDSYASTNNTGTDTWTYEGFGTLITSMGNFANQMKMKSSGGDMVLWNPSPLFPRVVANSSGVTVYMPGTSGVQEQNASVASLLVYPIPANTELNVITTDRDLKWFVRDTQGRLLMQGNWNMDASRTIDIATLTTGNYLLSVIGAKGSATTRFQKL